MNDINMEKIRKKKFIDNNGAVLRTINAPRTSYVSLKDVQYVLEPDVMLPEIMDSINYLHEIGYIKLRNICSKTETSLADDEFNALEAKLSAKGIQSLHGDISDPCVRW